MSKLNVNINPNDLKPITCIQCGCHYFRQVMAINKVSRFITGGEKDTMIPVPVFRCDDCGYIPEEFKPVSVTPKGK
jgi:predicted Zn-ribbon and HTH transcriptional regulator